MVLLTVSLSAVSFQAIYGGLESALYKDLSFHTGPSGAAQGSDVHTIPTPGSAAMSLGPKDNTGLDLLASSHRSLPISAYMSGGKDTACDWPGHKGNTELTDDFHISPPRRAIRV